jgi:hypothetical protein
MCDLDRSLFQWSVTIACLWRLPDVLLEAIASSLLVDTGESTGAAINTTWDITRTLDLYCGVRKDSRGPLRQVGGMSLLRLRQVLQALVLHK